MHSSIADPPRSEAALPAMHARSVPEIRQWIVAELARALRVECDSIDTAGPIYALGVDSLIAISMTGALAEWLGRELPVTLVLDHPSIDAMAQALGAPSETDLAPKGIIALQPGGARAPLFCFPGAGGHSATFAPMATHMGPDHPCFGLIAPGINGERPPFTRVEEIAAAMLENIRRIQPKGPYQLAGYSFGGLVAYEAAQQLQAADETVSLLAIYDTITADGQALRPRWQRLGMHVYVLVTKSGRRQHLRRHLKWGREMNQAHEPAPAAPPGNPTAAAVEHANHEAGLAYSPKPYAGSIVLFRAAARGVWGLFYRIERANGWEALAGGGVRVIKVTGNHFSILNPGNGSMAADLLRPYLSVT